MTCPAQGRIAQKYSFTEVMIMVGRFVSLTTRPEARLIEMFCNGDKRSVAVNAAYFLSPLERCSSATDAKQKAITFSTLVTVTAAIRTSIFLSQGMKSGCNVAIFTLLVLD